MKTISYSFKCPYCKVVQETTSKEKLKLCTIATDSDATIVCLTCAESENILVWKALRLTNNPVIIRTTIKCDCVGCVNSINFTDQPCTGTPRNLNWNSGKMPDPEHHPIPGLPHRMLDLDICPGCFKKIIHGPSS
jgi:hypothetical protein